MTYHPKSDFMRVMIERGYLADCTDYQALDEAFLKGVVPQWELKQIYAGMLQFMALQVPMPFACL